MNEVEVKFHVGRLRDLEQRVIHAGAKLIHPRVLETNLRFDTPDGQLRRDHRALRLRRDTVITLTHKGPGALHDGIRTRTEVEARVEDLDQTRLLLEGLGYVVVFEYEKQRTTYDLGGVQLMLDELPYGDFVELEGVSEELKPLAARLGLRWEAAIPHSYHALFEQLQAAANLPFHDLTFANFTQTAARVDVLGIPQADS